MHVRAVRGRSHDYGKSNHMDRHTFGRIDSERLQQIAMTYWLPAEYQVNSKGEVLMKHNQKTAIPAKSIIDRRNDSPAQRSFQQTSIELR